MGIISTFTENIGENARWNGRTQSDASWSPEQLGRDLRMQVDTVKIEDRTNGTLSICREIPTHIESNVTVMEHSGSRSS
jgi:hypothetical protein